MSSAPPPAHPTRVLHVLAGLGAGGVETWLMHLLRSADPARFAFDFVLNEGAPRHYDGEALARGARLWRGPEPRRALAYRRHLRSAIEASGCGVVHSHQYMYSGLVLAAARAAGVPIRIAHGHSAGTASPSRGRRLYEAAMRRLIHRNATRGLAVSGAAAAALFGPGWEDDPRYGVMDLGLDFAGYLSPLTRDQARARFGVPAGRLALGHIGSYRPEKNHGFLLDVAERLAGDGRDVHLLLLTSPSAAPLRAEVGRRGLEGRSTVPDTGADVPALLAATDVLLMPSVREGRGLAVLEAQAAGVPVVASEAIPADSAVVPGLVRRVPLEAGTRAWAAAVLEACAGERPQPAEANLAMRDSRFGIAAAWARLGPVYEGT